MCTVVYDAEIRDRVGQAESFSESLDILSDIVSRIGFTQTLYGYIPRMPRQCDGSWAPLKLNVRNFPDGWHEGWQQFMTVDPYYLACFDGIDPVDWIDVQNSDTISLSQSKALEFLGDYGLSRGITIPVHLPLGRFAVMSAIADNTCKSWHVLRTEAREPLFCVMHAFTKAIFRRGLERQIEVADQVTLTQREQECMRWAALGKTTSEIAIILDRSPETVRLHIKNSFTKLNATNRAQAVANALDRGLI
jgi:LuxR family transcriptional regulator